MMKKREDAVNRATNGSVAVCSSAWLSVALLCVLLAGTVACNYGGGSRDRDRDESEGSTESTTSFIDPLAPGVDSVAVFEDTTYPLLAQYCGECHATGPGSPLIAHTDVDAAFRATVNNQKVNLAAPENSRLVRQLKNKHHCWSECGSDGDEMAAAIADWADLIRVEGTTVTAEDGLATGTLRMDQGIEDTGSERYRENLVALFEFKQGWGNSAWDTSGSEPPMHLNVGEGVEWMSSYGVRFDSKSARVRAPPQSSRKLYDRIAKPDAGSQQYSVEAWVTPANVTQSGPRPIVTYSENSGESNFSLGQSLYNYDFRNRSLAFGIEEDGVPALTTYDADEDLQANLQHVVITYDQFRGRRIYVNAAFTDDEDQEGPGRLWSWNEDFHFSIGNYWDSSRSWEGQVRLVAIYAHALEEEQIQQNFNAGVGKRVLLRYDVSQWTGPGSFVEVTVSELDDYSYLLCQPTFLTPNPAGFRVSNLSIAVNGQVAVSGQAFPNIDATVTSAKQELSRQCSVIAQDQGPAVDAFTIEFEAIGNFEDPTVAEEPDYPAPPPPEVQDLPRGGVRDFARINEAMATLTEIDPLTSGIQATWRELEQQLPGSYDLRAYSSSQQVGISKLALEYCNALVDSPAARTAFFGAGFDFDDPATAAYVDATARNRLIDPLMVRMLGLGLQSQPDPADVRPLLDGLIGDLITGCDAASCGADRTKTVAKAACAALLSSAAVSMH